MTIPDSSRPPLTPSLSPDVFRNFYWLGKELQEFCRANGLSAVGPKIEMSDRIEQFLQTGEIKEPLKRPARKPEPLIELTLDTIITENHRCSQHVRAFFNSVIPKFHFSTYIQKYFRDNVGSTYRDAVEAWYQEEDRKKDPSYKTTIGAQFEYNQFIRDFAADQKNRDKTRKDAVAAWNIVKTLPGSNKYSRVE
jgi:hypothetical protein